MGVLSYCCKSLPRYFHSGLFFFFSQLVLKQLKLNCKNLCALIRTAHDCCGRETAHQYQYYCRDLTGKVST